MNNELQIYRKRLIPEECILLKDDIIVEQNDDYILTKWKTLNPKTTFSPWLFLLLSEGRVQDQQVLPS